MPTITRDDVFNTGAPREVFAFPPRRVEGVVPGLGLLQLRAHNLAAATLLTLALLSSSIPGATPSALPAGLAEGTAYYAQPGPSSDLLALSATPSGSPIATFGDAGVGVFSLLMDVGPSMDAAIVDSEALVEAMVVSGKAPFTAAVLRPIKCRLAARIWIESHAYGNSAYARSLDAISASSAVQKVIDRLLENYMSGGALPPGSSDATPTVVENAAVLIDLDGRGFLEREDCRA